MLKHVEHVRLLALVGNEGIRHPLKQPLKGFYGVPHSLIPTENQ